jgi:hypothetical protein
LHLCFPPLVPAVTKVTDVEEEPGLVHVAHNGLVAI